MDKAAVVAVVAVLVVVDVAVGAAVVVAVAAVAADCLELGDLMWMQDPAVLNISAK